MADHGAPADELGLSRGDRAVVVLGFPGLGAVVGYALPVVARWLLTLPWVPFGGPLRLVAALDDGWGRVAGVGAGVLLGAALAFIAVQETLKVSVGDDRLTLTLGERTRTVVRGEVDAVFVEGKQLVVLDRESRQVVRERLENAGSPVVERAFRAHGYPWVARDPYDELFRRWVPDLPDLPAAVNAVLAARAVALSNKSATDATELRDEVQKLGFTVRDDGAVQHWRPLVRS
jgi:hypothetical protein